MAQVLKLAELAEDDEWRDEIGGWGRTELDVSASRRRGSVRFSGRVVFGMISATPRRIRSICSLRGEQRVCYLRSDVSGFARSPPCDILPSVVGPLPWATAISTFARFS